jgi:hypothetical protein
MPRTATITLSVPMPLKATTHRLAAIGSTPLSSRIADLIRSFAANHALRVALADRGERE